MKMKYRKPKGCRVSEMKKVRRVNKFGGIGTTLVYPEGHPMRVYKDKKRELKAAK